MSAQLVQEMGPLQASDEAKRRYFGQRMAELVSNELTLYRKAMESTDVREAWRKVFLQSRMEQWGRWTHSVCR